MFLLYQIIKLDALQVLKLEEMWLILVCLVISEDKSEAIVGRYQVLRKTHTGYSRLLLEGLNTDFEYQIEGITGTFYGDELMYAGLHLEKVNGDFTSQVFKLNKK